MAASRTPVKLTARRYYTRRVPAIWWVAGPLLSLVLVCASLGAMIASYYADGVDRLAPTRYYEDSVAEIIVPITATRVNLWAEFPTTVEEASDLVDLYEYMGLSSYFTGTFADGTPWTLENRGDLRTYLRTDGDQLVVGVPIGSSDRGGDLASMADEIVPSGYALGFENSSVFNALPLVFILTALAGVGLFLATMTPMRNPVETMIESQRAERREEDRRARDATKSAADRFYRAQARDDHQRKLAEWQQRNGWALRRGELYDSAPVGPDTGPSSGIIMTLITIAVLGGPLWGILVAVATGVQVMNSQIAGDSILTVLLPLMGDTPWRVFVMAATALLLIGIGPVLGVIVSWRVDRPGLRTFAVIATLALLAVMLLFVIIGTTLPVDRGIQ